MTDPSENEETEPCAECGKPRRVWQHKRFCGSRCRGEFNNRRMRRGAVIYDIAMKWRKDRNGEDFNKLCTQLAAFLEDDKEKGRQSYQDDPEFNFPTDRER